MDRRSAMAARPADALAMFVLAAALAAALASANAEAAPHDPSLQAIAGYNVILEKNPDDIPTLRARGSTFRALELYDDALNDLEKADSLEPDHYETVGEIGVCHYMLGDIDRARDVLQRAERLFAARNPAAEEDSENAAVVEKELRETLMALYRERGDYEAALRQWGLMEKYVGGKLAAKCDRADILLDLGRVDEAMELYQAAVEWNGVFERFCVGAANCLILKGYQQKAIEIFENWAAEEPDFALPHMFRGVILRDHVGDEAASRAAIDEALRLAAAKIEHGDLPDFGSIIIQARVQQAAGDHTAAAGTIEPILEYSRGHYLVVHLLAVSYRALGRIDEADSLEKESRLYKRLNPRDWLQAYDIVAPKKEESGQNEAPGEPAGDSEAVETEDGAPAYLLIIGIFAVFSVVLLWLILRRR